MNTVIEALNAGGTRFAEFALPMFLQSALLIVLLCALDLALRKRVRATIRHAVWILALVKLALPPSLGSPTAAAYWLRTTTVGVYPPPTLTPLVTPTARIVSTTYKPTGELRQTTLADKRRPELTRQAVFFLVWLVVASGMALGVIGRLRVVLVVIRESAESPEALRSLVETCRRQLEIKRVIPVRCAEIGSPAICGVLRPIILIPPALAENLSMSEMRSVLLHELAHYKRSDLWVNHAQILSQVLYWYNPLVWLANASIRRAREQAVDEMVLVEMGEEAQAYPSTLVRVAKLGLGRPMAAMGLIGILEPGRGLTPRILHIMSRPLPRTARVGVRGLVAVLLLALVVVPMACRPKTAQVRDQTPPAVTHEKTVEGSISPKTEQVGEQDATAVDLNALGRPAPMDGGTARARSNLVALVEARQQVNDSPNAVTINLKPYVNFALTDPLPTTPDQTDSTFAALPSGVHTYGGVSFDVEGFIQLDGDGLSQGERNIPSTDAKAWPRSVTNIAVHSKFTKLHLLNSAWNICGPRYRTTFATVVLHYTDGSRGELQLVGGTHALRCLGPYVPPLLGLVKAPEAELAWLGTNPYLTRNMPNQGLHLFRVTLSNPKPGIVVTSMDYISAQGDGAPLLAGLTVE